MIGRDVQGHQTMISLVMMASVLSVSLPVALAAGQFGQRAGKMGYELRLPVERRVYLKQVGTGAALLQFQMWAIVSVVTLLWWLVVVEESVSWNTIAGILGISALSQVWLFAAMLWMARYRNMIIPIAVIASVMLGILMPIVTEGFNAAPGLTEQPHVFWIVSGLLTVFGVFVIWAAYRRWLVADID